MPRLDNSHSDVLEHFDLEFNWDDPGDSSPVDVCVSCAIGFPEGIQCEHPPYEEGCLDYICKDCGCKLGKEDN